MVVYWNMENWKWYRWQCSVIFQIKLDPEAHGITDSKTVFTFVVFKILNILDAKNISKEILIFCI